MVSDRLPSVLQRALAFGLTVVSAGLWFAPNAAGSSSRQDRSPWLKTESPRFEIHYVPVLERDLARVIRSAERAYDRISARLRFTLETKVPLMFAPSGTMTREEVVTYAISDRVAPQHPHRSRLVLPLAARDADLDGLMVHEGIASYMAAAWSDDYDRLMRELVASGDLPALSQLTGDGGFKNARLNEALGHAAFDFIVSRWGEASIRRFLNALIVPRVDKTYDAVFDLTPAEFDAAFRQYAERGFRTAVR